MNGTATLIGTTLDGKYRIDRLIGHGGMGAVFAGTHVSLERPVAIKVLKPEFLADRAAMRRFAREARTAARVEHPHAVGVYDFGAIEGGGAYLVMEYVEGRPLRSLLRERGPLPLGLAIDLIRQAAGAVGAAHARGVVHRDLKPENMLVREDETGRLVLKVVDFGIAKLLSSAAATLVTGPAELVGTPRYMAPEQFRDAAIDERIDVYALGVVLYEMLAGRSPFEGTMTEVIGKHLYTSPAPLTSLGIPVPEAVERALFHALAKDPNARTATATDLIEALDAACAAAGVGAFDPSPALAGTTPARPIAPESSSMATIDSAVPPSGVISRQAAEEFITRYLAGEADDQPTRVREVPVPTVVVPESASRLLPDASRPTPGGHAVAGPLALATGPLSRKRWLAPAALGIAGLLWLGIPSWEPGSAAREAALVSVPSGAVTAQASPSADPAPTTRPYSGRADAPNAARRPDPEPGRREATTTEQRRERQLAPHSARKIADPPVRHRRGASIGRRETGRDAGRTFKRAIRIDRHLKKLF